MVPMPVYRLGLFAGTSTEVSPWLSVSGSARSEPVSVQVSAAEAGAGAARDTTAAVARVTSPVRTA